MRGFGCLGLWVDQDWGNQCIKPRIVAVLEVHSSGDFKDWQVIVGSCVYVIGTLTAPVCEL